MIKAPLDEPNVDLGRFTQELLDRKLARTRLFTVERRDEKTKPLLRLCTFDCALMNDGDIEDFE